MTRPDPVGMRALFASRIVPLYGPPDRPMVGQVADAFDRLSYYCRLADIDVVAARGGRILDLGPGLAPFGPLLQLLGGRVTLVDDFGGGGCVDPQAPDQAREILDRIRRDTGLEIVEQDLLTAPLPAPDASVDVVTSFHCFEHLHHSPRFLMSEIRRVLRPGGRFVVGTPNAVNLRKRVSVLFGRTNLGELEEWYHDGTPFRGHVREPVVDDLVRLCTWNDLTVERIAGANFLGRNSKHFTRMPAPLRPVVRLMMRRLLPVWPRLCSDIHVVAVKHGDSGH